MGRCRVSYTDTEGINHTVEVDAESLYEAVAVAVAEFRADAAIENQPAAMTEFTVVVLRRPVEHRVRLKKVAEWAQPSTVGGPAEILRRERARKMLASSHQAG